MIRAQLEMREAQGLLRNLTFGERLIDLTSNDYFGFAKIKRAQTACTGATGSRLLTGNSPFYEELEQKIAAYHGAESCLIFNSGYTANLGLISALGKATFLYDLEIHASMIDGMRLSEGKMVPFRHNNLESLEQRLKKTSPPTFVLVESIYSISGDLAPLEEISRLSDLYGAELIVDEAHATDTSHVKAFARVRTFSKALGAHGACVLGSRELKQYLINFSRPLIYTTALPPSVLMHISESYDKWQSEGDLHREKLKRLIAYFCRKTGAKMTQSPIRPIYVGKFARELSQTLREKGLDVRAILPPTIAKGRECLRLVLHSFNQEDEIDLLLETIS
ncbi:MAG: aminotransferase class I/II-fold pyridoxal phosphate-dependent enzyme [Verrucomicrobia bacterium]|nr:aminotransferase class I/II-fold pyridoxal phosphate-dependent enzyme [Verrucomicrobiota bacterium]